MNNTGIRININAYHFVSVAKANKIKKSDAILVLNYDKNEVKNYIGGNTLIEIGFAHYWKTKIFLLNPIPEIPYYKSEIEAVKPVIINGDLSKILE